MSALNRLKTKISGFSKWEIRKKLLFSYIAMTIISMLIIGIYSYFQLKLQAEKNTEDSMNVVLRTKSVEIESEINNAETVILNIRTNKNLFKVIEKGYAFERDGYRWNDMDNVFVPALESYITNSEYIQRITIYTKKTVPETGSMLLNESRIKTEEWYKKACESSGIKWFYEDGRLFAACRFIDLWDNVNEYIGIIYLEVSPGIWQVENSFDDKAVYKYQITDLSGNVIYRDEAVKQDIVHKKNGAEIDGKQYFYVSCPISEGKWELNVYTPRAQMYSYLRRIYLVTVIVMLLCIAVITALGIWFSNMITVNIRKLNNAMTEIGNGNFDVEISVNSEDEMGAIARQLRKMLCSLKETIQSLYEAKIEKQKQEITTLQSQINPHFLYNILSTIKWTAIEENADDTGKIVGMLSDFYRTCLNRGDTVIAFGDELLNVEAYVNMELIIHDYDFDVEYDISDEIYEYNCINFILQPIVENAIFHGIKGKKSTEKGKIVISAAVGENIEIAVSDNGIGMSERTVKEVLSREGRGYGLANIQRRINLIYGEEYGLDITSGEDGTEVRIRLPKVI